MAAYSSGSAASLQGKVVEVVDGESIAILSQTHTLKVKLIGVAVPNKNQAYAAIAQQHLSDLILNKFVLVRYSALRDGYLVGQVMLGEMDVCGQMIRDGVAWYQPHEGDLSEIVRQVYQASQEAARGERRGLWQDDSPIAPWDFRKTQLATINTPTVYPSLQPTGISKSSRAGLSSEDLVGGALQPGSMAGKPEVRPLSSEGAPGRWLKYQPSDKHFSILAPSDGVEMTYKVLAPQGKIMNIHYVVGVNSGTIYLVTWAKGPSGISTDASAEADAINGMLSGLNGGRERAGSAVLTATPGRSLTVDGYAGRQYSLNAGPAFGVVRVLTKQFGDEREVFLLGVLNSPEATNSGSEFLNSFKIRQN